MSQGREPHPDRSTVEATRTRLPTTVSGPDNPPPDITLTAAVLLICTERGNDIEDYIGHAVLRVDTAPRAELLFYSPARKGPRVKTIVGHLLTLLFIVGVRPVALSEPTLDPSDLTPERPCFHPGRPARLARAVAEAGFVMPWEWPQTCPERPTLDGGRPPSRRLA